MGKKLFPYLIALAALSVSASAAFYSVSGLMKLFAGASLAVGIMAGSLEVSKLVIASLLYQYWTSLNKMLKTYLTLATIILILITSAGIYGFLSSAYQETANKDQIVTQQITALETKKGLFEQTRDGLVKEKQALADLRGTLSKASTTQYTDRNGNLVVRSNNASIKQIDRASSTDDKLSSKLDVINDSIFSLENKILQVKTNATATSELGPLKYLAGLTGYPMDKIINWFLLIIIFVFDPLAIALVIAANFAFTRKDEKPAPEATEKEDDNAYEQETKEWEEASLTDLQDDIYWDEDHATDQVLNDMVKDIPEEEWKIEHEEQEVPESEQVTKQLDDVNQQIADTRSKTGISSWKKNRELEDLQRLKNRLEKRLWAIYGEKDNDPENGIRYM